MNKVLDFLEKYAQYLAMGIAVIFLGLVAYSSIISPTALQAKVGAKEVLPGDVDPAVAEQANLLLRKMSYKPEQVKPLAASKALTLDRLPQSAARAPVEIEKSLQVKSFATEFAAIMESKKVEVVGPPVRPGVPLEEGPKLAPGEQNPKLALADPPAATPVRTISVQGYFAQPPAGGDPNNPVPVVPVGGNVNGFDKNIVTMVWKITMKDLADAWAKVYPKTLPINIQPILTTRLLYVEMEREELIGKDASGKEIWSNRTLIKPLPLVETAWPPAGRFVDKATGQALKPDAAKPFEHEYLLWAEKHQTDIVLPPMYQQLAGDPWQDLVMGLQPRAAADAPAVPVADNQPFDPANPPNRELTSSEKQQVYLHNLKKKKEEEQQAAAARKAQMDAARNRGGSRENTRPPRGGGRGAGNPAPGALLAAGDPITNAIGAEPRIQLAAAPAPARGVPAKPAPVERPAPGAVRPTPGAEVIPATVQNYQQNPALGAEFNPIALADGAPIVNPDGGGVPGAVVPQIDGWCHDETAQPGHTYRYRVRYYLRNPLYNQEELCANRADADKFWIVSAWSNWELPQAQKTIDLDTVFFFASDKRAVANKAVQWVTANVFKRSKGAWIKETFTLYPGDSIGQKKGEVDFSTPATIIDLRSEVRDDTRILVADEKGHIQTRFLNADKNDAWHKELLQKLNVKPEGGDPNNPQPPPEGAPAPGLN